MLSMFEEGEIGDTGSKVITRDHKLISENKEFVINIITENMVDIAILAGSYSGKYIDKFEKLGLTPLKARYVKSPMIKESPINIEAKVSESIVLGSHELFIGEVIATWVDSEYLTDKIRQYKKISPLVYCSPNFYTILEKPAVNPK